MQPNPHCLVDLREGIESDVFCYALVVALDALCSDPSVIWNRHASQVISQPKHWHWIEEIQVNSAVLANHLAKGEPVNLEPVLSAGYGLAREHDPHNNRLVSLKWVTPKGDFRVGLKDAIDFRAR
jgi:hypothetical protein